MHQPDRLPEPGSDWSPDSWPPRRRGGIQENALPPHLPTPEDHVHGPSNTGQTPSQNPDRGKQVQAPCPPPRCPLPRWHVVLRDQDWYELNEVIDAIVELTPLGESLAIQRMFEAHYTGSAFLLATHRERAELYQHQFATRELIVAIEPAE